MFLYETAKPPPTATKDAATKDAATGEAATGEAAAEETTEDAVCYSSHSALLSDQTTTYRSFRLHGHVLTPDGTRCSEWPERTDVHCWFDSFPFDTTPIPIPMSYNKSTRTYTVTGNMCSVPCALAHIARSCRPHALWETVCRFREMMDTVFHMNVTGVTAAAPFISLSRFGGSKSIEEFRADALKLRVNLLEPPFIPYPIFFEEKVWKNRNTQSGHVLRGLRRPAVIEERIPVTEMPATGGIIQEFLETKEARALIAQTEAEDAAAEAERARLEEERIAVAKARAIERARTRAPKKAKQPTGDTTCSKRQRREVAARSAKRVSKKSGSTTKKRGSGARKVNTLSSFLL
jgi:hypothetical protein